MGGTEYHPNRKTNTNNQQSPIKNNDNLNNDS